MKMNVLLVEDDPEHISDFEAHRELFSEKKVIDIQHVSCTTDKDAYAALEANNFDAAIIDLNLHGKEDAGLRVVETIHDKYRIPMIVFSGNAYKTEGKKYVFKSINKGRMSYSNVLEELYNIKKTGIMKILGKTGLLESLIDRIFWDNINPQMHRWLEYAQNEDTEQHLLRYTISHFQEILRDGVKYFYPEEMYISPPINEEISTGSIVFEVESENYFVVMSPACDIQSGCDKLVLAKVIEIKELVADKISGYEDKKASVEAFEAKTTNDERKVNPTKKEYLALKNQCGQAKNELKDQIKSYIDNPPNRLHFLSSNSIFMNSIIDFQDIKSVAKERMTATNYKKVLSISLPFLKDIQSRFSSYYARQGSPDFDTSKILEKCNEKLNII
jgi:CheY-like chemotaxis protein